ncbi:hypothetical protein SAMN05444678_103193 [Sphingomonas sp. YR710]|uniref:hypothetical protein n=1 Tax=Sphingomonas sp. YR710 TaxID=1882773 RepID=UPI00087FD7D3|nr:hypothetical protein [Sphingomonas sp. YR710]SDC49404.1 hypothetical protein SAMN05444678_103193 [Sphingomonas sp. YR710]
MGGLANIIADSSYNGPNVGYSLPVSRGARTVLFPRVDGPTSIANKVDVLAGGVGNATVVGTPGYGAGYASFTTASNYFNSGSLDASTTTIMAVVRASQSFINGPTQPIIGGNFTLGVSGLHLAFDDNIGAKGFVARRVTTVSGVPTNSSPLRLQYGASFTASISGSTMTVTGAPVGVIAIGNTIFGSNVTSGTMVVSGGTGTGGVGTYNLNVSSNASGAMAAIGDWAFVACSFQNGGNITIYNKTLGISNFLAVTTSHIAGAGNFKVGTSFSNTVGGLCDIAYWAEHNVALTTFEIDSIYQAVKSKLSSYSTPIII